MNTAQFVPMLGVAPHSPARCIPVRAVDRESDANKPDAIDPRKGEQPPRRKGKRRQTESGPCGTCGGRIPVGSVFVCLACHSVAPDVAAKVGRHALPALEFDARYGDNREKQAKKAAAEAKAAKRKEVRLTAKQRKGLLKDARAGDQPLPLVQAFLATAG